MWFDIGISAPTWSVVCGIDSHCSGSVASHFKGPPLGPLVGPSGVVPVCFDHETTETLITYPLTIFHNFWLLKATQIGLGTLVPFWTSFWTSWTLLDIFVLKPPIWPKSIKMDLKTEFIPHDTYVRLYDTSWIFLMCYTRGFVMYCNAPKVSFGCFLIHNAKCSNPENILVYRWDY